MKSLFTFSQSERIISDYKFLVDNINYLPPYPTLKVGFIRAQLEPEGLYKVYVGVSPRQLEIPEFMGFVDHCTSLEEFISRKGLKFDPKKYAFD